MPANDEASLKGKGADILLPGRGNPFQPGQPPGETAEAAAVSFSTPAMPTLEGTPDLSPEDLAKLFPDVAPTGSTPESTELPEWANFEAVPPAEAGAEAFSFGVSAGDTPEDAALAEMLNNPSPAWANFQDEAEPASAEVVSFGLSGTTEAVIPPELIASETVPDLPGVPTEAEPELPEFVRVEAEPAVSMATSTPLTVNVSAGLNVEPSDLGPRSSTFTRPSDLPADAGLVKLLVTDERMLQTWAEIDALENEIAVTPKLSQGVAEEMFARLTTARNRLMSGRDHVEEAEQEIAAAKYRFARVRRTKWFEEPSKLFGYLVVMLVLVGVGLFVSLGLQGFSVPNDFSVPMLLSAAFAGGIGGVAGGMFALLNHVSNKKDYDPEYALWYYVYPIIGVLLGALVYIVVKLGLFQIGNSQPLTIYVLAPLIGFKQDVAFRWINNWLKQVTPSGDSK
jgi:hypothetical protein